MQTQYISQSPMQQQYPMAQMLLQYPYFKRSTNNNTNNTNSNTQQNNSIPFSTASKKAIKRRHMFSKEEDTFLRFLVGSYGEHNWDKIAEIFGTRTARQCKDRYCNYLSPKINNMPFSSEEDELILTKVKEYGRKWTLIAPLFKSRTEVSLKNRYNVLVGFYKSPMELNNNNESNSTTESPQILEAFIDNETNTEVNSENDNETNNETNEENNNNNEKVAEEDEDMEYERTWENYRSTEIVNKCENELFTENLFEDEYMFNESSFETFF